jgi:hypothetical protein
MNSEKSCKFQMTIGKHKGKTLEEIATKYTDGPGYLDWMVGLHNLSDDLKEALECFLDIPWVKELVDRAVEEHTTPMRSEPIENIKKTRPWWEKKP